jgi:hypothetical protein
MNPIALKILSGRAEDLEDVRRLLAEGGDGLDLDSIRSTLAHFETALGRTDLLPLFERQLECSGPGREPADPAAVSVKYEDLELAFEFVSSSPPFEHSAYVSLETGGVYWESEDEELPEDIDDADRYVAVPHKNDLDLGRDLALRFAEAHVSDRYHEIADAFRHRGAYGRFKSILASAGRLDAWYAFEATETDRALEEWCAENGLRLTRRAPTPRD